MQCWSYMITSKNRKSCNKSLAKELIKAMTMAMHAEDNVLETNTFRFCQSLNL